MSISRDSFEDTVPSEWGRPWSIEIRRADNL